MKKLTPSQLFKKRMADAYLELAKIAQQKTQGKNATTIYWRVADALDISGQTVINYANGNTKTGNGYLIDALIEEFKKLPDTNN